MLCLWSTPPTEHMFDKNDIVPSNNQNLQHWYDCVVWCAQCLFDIILRITYFVCKHIFFLSISDEHVVNKFKKKMRAHHFRYINPTNLFWFRKYENMSLRAACVVSGGARPWPHTLKLDLFFLNALFSLQMYLKPNFHEYLTPAVEIVSVDPNCTYNSPLSVRLLENDYTSSEEEEADGGGGGGGDDDDDDDSSDESDSTASATSESLVEVVDESKSVSIDLGIVALPPPQPMKNTVVGNEVF